MKRLILWNILFLFLLVIPTYAAYCPSTTSNSLCEVPDGSTDGLEGWTKQVEGTGVVDFAYACDDTEQLGCTDINTQYCMRTAHTDVSGNHDQYGFIAIQPSSTPTLLWAGTMYIQFYLKILSQATEDDGTTPLLSTHDIEIFGLTCGQLGTGVCSLPSTYDPMIYFALKGSKLTLFYHQAAGWSYLTESSTVTQNGSDWIGVRIKLYKAGGGVTGQDTVEYWLDYNNNGNWVSVGSATGKTFDRNVKYAYIGQNDLLRKADFQITGMKIGTTAMHDSCVKVSQTCVGPDKAAIEAAVSSASYGDTIQLCPGTFTFNSTLQINKPVVLKGAGRDATIIQPSSTWDVVCPCTSPCSFGSYSDPPKYLINFRLDSSYSLISDSNVGVEDLTVDMKLTHGGINAINLDSDGTPATKYKINNVYFKNAGSYTKNGSQCYTSALANLGFVKGGVFASKFEGNIELVNQGWGLKSWDYDTFTPGSQNSFYYEDNEFIFNTMNYVLPAVFYATKGVWRPDVAGAGGSSVWRWNTFTWNNDTSESEYIFDLHGNTCRTERAVTSITSVGTVATVTQTAHGYSTGNAVIISGASPSGYNGVKTITRLDADRYTYNLSTTLSSPATGTIVEGYENYVWNGLGHEAYGNLFVDTLYKRPMQLYHHRGGRAHVFYNRTVATSASDNRVLEYENQWAGDGGSSADDTCMNTSTSCGIVGGDTNTYWEYIYPNNSSCGAGDGVGQRQPQHVWRTYLFNNRNGALGTAGDRVKTYITTGSSPAAALQVNKQFFTDVSVYTETPLVTCGTLANRPTACTRGQGYWVPNASIDPTASSCNNVNNWVGVNNNYAKLTNGNIGSLHRCTTSGSPGVWNGGSETPYYTPLAYPHPLRGTTPDPTPTTKGPLTVSPTQTNTRYFEDRDGNSVWLSGYHTWANLQDISVNGDGAVFNWDLYIDSLKSKGMNHIRLWSLQLPKSNCGSGLETTTLLPWNRSATTGATDGGNKFDLTSFNSSYFTRLANRVADAAANGIYVSVMLFEGYGLQFCRLDGVSPNGDGHPFSSPNNINSISDGFLYDANGTKSGTNAMRAPGESGHVAAIFTAQKAYIDKVIETVDSYDNVFYEIANEAGGASNAWQDALISYIKSKTTKPVGKTFAYSGGTDTQLNSSTAHWVSYGGSTYQNTVLTVPVVAPGAKVSILDTDHIGGGGFSTSRTYLWKAFTRGHNLISMADGIDSNTSNLAAHRAVMSQMRTYVDKIDLENMPPLGTISSTGYSLEKANSEYLIYQPANASFSLYLTGIAGIYSVEWLNVATGVTTAGSDITGGSSTPLTMTYSGPGSVTDGVVLYIKKKSDPPPSPGIWYTNSCSNTDIQAVIDAPTTLDGHTVMVKKGSCTWTAPIVITKGISLIGAGSNPADCTNSTCITSGLENGGRPITSITRSGTTATVYMPNHGFTDEGRTYERIHIYGANQPEYNGVKDVTWVDADHVKFTVSGTPATPATGTITTGYGMGVHLISVFPQSSKKAYLYRVSNMAFDGMDWSYHVLFSYSANTNSFDKTRLDNCFFKNTISIRNRGIAHGIMYSGFVNGVMDHNIFDARGSNEGIVPTRWSSTWDNCAPGTTGDARCKYYSDLLPWDNGMGKDVYIENNTFIYNDYPQMIATGSGGSTVVRYNVFDYSESPGYFYTQDTHGHQKSWVTAGFGGEVYGNLVKGNPSVTEQNSSLGSWRGNKQKIFYNKYSGNKGYSGIGIHNMYPVKYLEATNPDGYPDFWQCLPGSLYSDTATCSSDGRNQHPSHTYVWNNRNSRKDYSEDYDLMIITTGRGDRCRSPYSDICTTGTTVTITSAAGLATVTHTSHGAATGNMVKISGANQSEYNGTFAITKTGTNTYTYRITGTPASPATGTIKAIVLNNCFPPAGTCETFPSPLDYDVRWLRNDQDVDCTDPDSSSCNAPNYELWFDSGGWNKYYNVTTARGWMQTGDNSFDGTKGIGCGTLANRPSTCTQGVGYWVPDSSMYGSGLLDPCGTIPVGSFGVNPTIPIRGTLYMCGSSNWTNATTYTPYPYPHPLTNPGPVVDTTPPVLVPGTISPPSTPVISCTPPSTNVQLSFQVTEYQTPPVSCLGCVLGTDGCTATSTYAQINSMPSKIVFSSSQSGNVYTQTATRTSTCGLVHNIVVACTDSVLPKNEMTPNALINYSTAYGIEPTPPGLISITLQPDGRTFSFLFNQLVKVDTTYNTGKDIDISGGLGSFGLIYTGGSGTNTLNYQIANCQPESVDIMITVGNTTVYNLLDIAFPGVTDKAVVNNSALEMCASDWVGVDFPSLFDQTEAPPYTVYTQGTSGPTILGTTFVTEKASRMTHICFYKDSAMSTEEHVGMIFGPSGNNPNALLAQKVFSGETSSGWQCQALDTPIPILKESYHTVAVKFPLTWIKSSDYFSSAFVNYLTGSPIDVDTGGGKWIDSPVLVYPSNSTTSNFWVDFILDWTDSWTVTASKTGSGCNISPSSQAIADGNSASATISLMPGWLVSWSDTCGGGSAVGNVYTVTSVTDDCNIAAACSTIKKLPWLIP